MIRDIEKYPYRTLPLRPKNKLRQYGRMLDNAIVYSIVNSTPTTSYWLRVPAFKFICGIQFGTQTTFNPSSVVRMYESYSSTGSIPENYKLEAAIMTKALPDHRIIPHYWPNVDTASMWHAQLGYGATTTKEVVRMLARKLQEQDDYTYSIENTYAAPIMENNLSFLYIAGCHMANWASVGWLVPDGYQIDAYYSQLANPKLNPLDPLSADQNYIICSSVVNNTGNSIFGIDKYATYDTGMIAIPQNLCRMFCNLNEVPSPKNVLGNRNWLANFGNVMGSAGSAGMAAPRETSTIKLPNGRYASIVKNMNHLVNLGRKGAEDMKIDEILGMVNSAIATAIFATYTKEEDPRMTAKFGPSGSGPANSAQRKEYYRVRDNYVQRLESADSLRNLYWNTSKSYGSGLPDVSFK